VSGSARSSNRFSKRISNTSVTSTFSNRSSNGSRLSTLFVGRVAQQTGVSVRASMPPPPRPMPTFAPPPVPRPESAGVTQTSFSQSDRRRSRDISSSSRSSQVSVEKLPPLALPPSGPLPPIPGNESETDLTQTAKPVERTRLLSAPSPVSPSSRRKIDHPFGRLGSPSETSHGGTFMDTFTPESTPKAELPSLKVPHYSSGEFVPIALSPPPRRPSQKVNGPRAEGQPTRRAANGMSIRSSAVML
jgi:hypothetical protein